MRRLNPETLPTPAGPYAHIVFAGDFAFIAGQLALDVQGQLIGGDDHQAQAVQSFTNLKLALEAIGVGRERIARMTLNIARHTPPVLEMIGKAGEAVFGPDWPISATTLIGVQTLGLPEWLVETEAQVYLGDG